MEGEGGQAGLIRFFILRNQTSPGRQSTRSRFRGFCVSTKRRTCFSNPYFVAAQIACRVGFARFQQNGKKEAKRQHVYGWCSVI